MTTPPREDSANYMRVYRILTGVTTNVLLPTNTIAELLAIDDPRIDWLIAQAVPADQLDAIVRVHRHGLSTCHGSGRPIDHPTDSTPTGETRDHVTH